jgi:hypothetical protein
MAESERASQVNNSHQDRALGVEGDRTTAAQAASQVGVSREQPRPNRFVKSPATLPISTFFYTAKLSPQEQCATAFGFVTLKPPF